MLHFCCGPRVYNVHTRLLLTEATGCLCSAVAKQVKILGAEHKDADLAIIGEHHHRLRSLYHVVP